MAASNFSNARVQIRDDMTVGPDYQVSCWIQPSDNWDQETNKPKPITTVQYNTIGEIMDIINSNNFSLSIVIRERNEGQARGWLEKMKFKLFANDDQENREPVPQTQKAETTTQIPGAKLAFPSRN